MQRRQATLKEKFSEHYMKRNFTPKKTQASTLGMTFTLIMMVSLVIEGLFVLLPWYYEEGSSSCRLAQFLVIFLFVESAAHYWLTYYDSSNRVTQRTKEDHFPNMSETPPGWKSCVTCMLDAPPRSHHCTLCNHCILKRDHHCFFTGSCVGYHNQRYFVYFCLYSLLASGYGLLLQFFYLNHHIPLFSYSWAFYFAPVAFIQFLSGTVPFINLFVLIHLYAAVGCFGGALFFLGWQLLLIWRGQTSFEAWKMIMIYRRNSVFNNFYDVFGNPLSALFNLIVPIRLDSPASGVKWTIDPKTEKGH